MLQRRYNQESLTLHWQCWKEISTGPAFSLQSHRKHAVFHRFLEQMCLNITSQNFHYTPNYSCATV